MEKNRYPLIHRILHWSIGIGIIGLLALGFYMGGLESSHPNRFDYYMWHKSLGVTVLMLAVLRLMSRILNNMPKMPKTLSWLEKFMASAVHFLLYVVMFAMPVSGIVMSNAAGYPVKWFSIELPRMVEKNPEIGHFAHNAHQILAWMLVGLIALHVLGALKHRFFDKENDVLPRMM